MRDTDILDKDIPGADPAAIVAQYDAFIRKIARRYTPVLDKTGAVDLDDLQQVGRCALLNAQSKYDPAEGGSFASFAFNWIRSAMRRALGFSSTGAPPLALDYLDEPLTGEDGCDTSRLDMIPDPSILPFDEPLIEEETHQETALEVRAALGRLKNERQREIIQRIYFNGEKRKAIAADMGITGQGVSVHENAAFRKLRHDKILRRIAEDTIPFIHIGVNKFRSTWTSATEWAVLWRDEHLPQYAQEPGREGKMDDFS